MRHVLHAHAVVGLVPPVLVERGHVEAAHLARVRLHAHAVQRRRRGDHGAIRRGQIHPGLLQHEQHVLTGQPRVEHVDDDHVTPVHGHAHLPALQLGAVAVRDGDPPGHLIERHVAAATIRELAVPLARDHLRRAGPRGHHGQQPGPGAYVQHLRAPVGTRDRALNLTSDGGIVRPGAFLVPQKAEVVLGERRDAPVKVEVFRLLHPELHAHGVVDARHGL